MRCPLGVLDGDHLAVHQPQRLAGRRRRVLPWQSQGVDVAGRREEPLLQNFAEGDGRVRLGLGVFVPHPGEDGLRAGKHVLGEAPLLAVEEAVVVDVDLGGPVGERLRDLLVGVDRHARGGHRRGQYGRRCRCGRRRRHGDVPLPTRFAPHVGDDGPHSGVVFGLRRVVDAVYGAACREWFDHLQCTKSATLSTTSQGGCPIQAFRRQVVDQWRAGSRLPGQVREGDHRRRRRGRGGGGSHDAGQSRRRQT